MLGVVAFYKGIAEAVLHEIPYFFGGLPFFAALIHR
jgi:hypothetical protein